MENKTMNIVCPSAEIERLVKEYLGKYLYKLDVTLFGTTAIVNVEYRGFKPTRTVRRELEDLIQNMSEINVVRSFSPESYSQALEELSHEDPEVYVKDADGALRPSTIMVMLEERLYSRTLMS